MPDKLVKRFEREAKIRRQKAGFVQIEALLKEAILDLEGTVFMGLVVTGLSRRTRI
jgi:hypothetical protein